jgi:hypothetical protein
MLMSSKTLLHEIASCFILTTCCVCVVAGIGLKVGVLKDVAPLPLVN